MTSNEANKENQPVIGIISQFGFDKTKGKMIYSEGISLEFNENLNDKNSIEIPVISGPIKKTSKTKNSVAKSTKKTTTRKTASKKGDKEDLSH